MPTRPATIILHLDVEDNVTDEDLEYIRMAAVTAAHLENSLAQVVDAEHMFGAIKDYKIDSK